MKKYPGTEGTWFVEDDCQIYCTKVALTYLEVIEFNFERGKDRHEAIKSLAESKIINPVFPHVWWKDEINYEDTSMTIYFTRSWFEAGKAKFVPEEEE